MKELKIFSLIFLCLLSCKTDKTQHQECQVKGKLENIQIIRFHKWDGLRPNKIELNFKFESNEQNSLKIIDTSSSYQYSDVQKTCLLIVINDSIKKPLYQLKRKLIQLPLNETRNQLTVYFDFNETYGMSLIEMKQNLPDLDKIELQNQCENICIDIDQNFNDLKIRLKLDGEDIQESDSINMNLNHNLSIKTHHNIG